MPYDNLPLIQLSPIYLPNATTLNAMYYMLYQVGAGPDSGTYTMVVYSDVGGPPGGVCYS